MNIMLEYDDMLNIYNNKKEHMQKCETCGGKGKININDEAKEILSKYKNEDFSPMYEFLFQIISNSKKYCECAYISEKYTIFDLEDDINRLKNIINNIPEEYQNRNIYINDLFLKSQKKLLWIYGIPGSGKTATLIHTKAFLKWKYNKYCIIYDFNADFDLKNIENAEYIGIDDIIRIQNYNYSYLLDYIYSASHKTIITSNYSIKDFINIIAKNDIEKMRYLSRLNSIAIEIQTKDIDYRLKRINE